MAGSFTRCDIITMKELIEIEGLRMSEMIKMNEFLALQVEQKCARDNSGTQSNVELILAKETLFFLDLYNDNYTLLYIQNEITSITINFPELVSALKTHLPNQAKDKMFS